VSKKNVHFRAGRPSFKKNLGHTVLFICASIVGALIKKGVDSLYFAIFKKRG